MQPADRSIWDKLAPLTQRERTVRQQDITEELINILTGFDLNTRSVRGAKKYRFRFAP